MNNKDFDVIYEHEVKPILLNLNMSIQTAMRIIDVESLRKIMNNIDQIAENILTVVLSKEGDR